MKCVVVLLSVLATAWAQGMPGLASLMASMGGSGTSSSTAGEAGMGGMSAMGGSGSSLFDMAGTGGSGSGLASLFGSSGGAGLFGRGGDAMTLMAASGSGRARNMMRVQVQMKIMMGNCDAITPMEKFMMMANRFGDDMMTLFHCRCTMRQSMIMCMTLQQNM